MHIQPFGGHLMILLIDNYDSFTFNIVQYLRQLQFDVHVARNDELTIEDIRHLQPEAIVLSPGPGTPDDAGISLEVVQALHTEIPILGICLGQQIIAQAFGATVKKASRPMHGKVSHITHNETGMFAAIPSPTPVARYHSLIVTDLPPSLVATAYSEEGEIQAIQHTTSKMAAVQFHPESILTTHGLQMLENFFNTYCSGGQQ